MATIIASDDTGEERFRGKHADGPWTFDGPDHNIIVWAAQPEHRVCFMTSDGPARANARLIAAAPDLLDALKVLTANVEHAWPSLANLGPLVEARAAISKAESQT